MKKLVSIMALAAILISMNGNAQTKKPKEKAKKECSAAEMKKCAKDKKTCTPEEMKTCTKEKKAGCCANKAKA
ncbi:MAG: hypothetical protein ABI549_07690 [Flavobacterium sp.]|uniref:hypothetical protein n=1 Tax=Flavobacterium sp. TaxID=239 RepID=UPI003265243F